MFGSHSHNLNSTEHEDARDEENNTCPRDFSHTPIKFYINTAYIAFLSLYTIEKISNKCMCASCLS